jgi:hypothetical protein
MLPFTFLSLFRSTGDVLSSDGECLADDLRSAHTNDMVDLELAPSSSCEPLSVAEGEAATYSSNQPHACGHGTGITASTECHTEEENVDAESQLGKKPSTIHVMLKEYGSMIALLAILVLHIVLALNGGANAAGHSNITLSLGACNDAVNVNASHVGGAVDCFRMNQTFGS